MRAIHLAIPEVILLAPKPFADARGFFMETWRADHLAELGIGPAFVQGNHSRSAGGTLRGLHYQIRRPQGKLVRVVRGAIHDVVVDMRRSSPTFGQWVSTRLSEDNRHLLWVPPGFAHGFYVLSEVADFLYDCTDYYAPEHERTLAWNDPQLGIDWPLMKGRAPILSVRDRCGQPLAAAECYP